MSLWTPPAFVPQRKFTKDFRGPDGKWQKLVVEENGDAVIRHKHYGDGQVDACVTPNTIEVFFTLEDK